MKLKTITETMNGNGLKTPEQIMAATLAAIEVRGGYTKASEANSTKEDVRMALWGIGAQAGDPSVAFMHARMKDPQIQNQAATIIAWAKAMKITPNTPDFLRNAQLIANKPELNDRQVGFICALYPFYEREVGKMGASGQRLSRTWPAAWGEVKMLWKKQVVVDSVEQRHSQTGSFQMVNMIMDNQYMFGWVISDGGTVPPKGKKIEITGYLEPSPRGDNTIRFYPDRRWARAAKRQLNIGEQPGRPTTDDDDGADVSKDD